MENVAFEEEEYCTEEMSDQAAAEQAIVEMEDDTLQELPLLPYNSCLYVATWPVLKVHDLLDSHWDKMKLVGVYVIQIVWLIFIIIGLIKNPIKTLPFFIITIIWLIYTKAGSFIRKGFEKINLTESSRRWIKIIFGIIAVIILIGLAQ